MTISRNASASWPTVRPHHVLPVIGPSHIAAADRLLCGTQSAYPQRGGRLIDSGDPLPPDPGRGFSFERVRNRRRLPDFEWTVAETPPRPESDDVHIVPYYPEKHVWESARPYFPSAPFQLFSDDSAPIAHALDSLSPASSPLWSLTRCSVILSRQGTYAEAPRLPSAAPLTVSRPVASEHRIKRHVPSAEALAVLKRNAAVTTAAPSHDVVSEPVPRQWIVIGKQPVGAIYIRRQSSISSVRPSRKTLSERQREYAFCVGAYRALAAQRGSTAQAAPTIFVVRTEARGAPVMEREAETMTRGVTEPPFSEGQQTTMQSAKESVTHGAAGSAMPTIGQTGNRSAIRVARRPPAHADAARQPVSFPESIFFPVSSPLRFLLPGSVLPWRNQAPFVRPVSADNGSRT